MSISSLWPKKPFFAPLSPKKSTGKGLNCDACGLSLGCRTPRMPPSGEGRRGVLIVPEAPGGEEDEQGTQLVGGAGQLLREKLASHGLDLDRDFWKTNSIICRPPNNREPSLKELRCCRHYLDETIAKYKPTMIWVMGNSPLKSVLLNKRFNKPTIGNWRKRCIPDPEFNAWIVPLLHPSFADRNQGNKNVESVYDRDLKWAVSLLGKRPPTFPNLSGKVIPLTDFNELTKLLLTLAKIDFEMPFIFDYETTSIKPQYKESKVVSISYCIDPSHAYAFPYEYPGAWSQQELKAIKECWKAVLLNPYLMKSAHNLKFEDGWSRHSFVQPVNWSCCTMTTQHILDCRSLITGLKVQAYFRWGIVDYDKPIEPFIDGNPINKMMEAPLPELLKYGGTDSLIEYWLYQEQQKELNLPSNKPLKQANQLSHEGLLALADSERCGINMDLNYYLRKNDQLSRRIIGVGKKLVNSPEYKLFEEKENRALKWDSPKDLSTLMFKHMGIHPTKETAKGNFSVDAEALEMYEDKATFVKDLVGLRKLEKTKNTYLAQFMREIADDGRMYPISNLHLARTFRSSMNSPSFQNIPVRDEESKKAVRMGIVPSPGNKIMEGDFSGIEVRIAASYTQDPTLINYLITPESDMHRDQAQLLFKLSNEETTKDIRFYAKNQWVFPQFYGSYFVSCARDLYKSAKKLNTADGKPLLEHLKDKRIVSYQAFEDHCRAKEKEFWDRFPVFKQWQERTVDFYHKRGYVEMFHGFRRAELLDRNKLYNTPIQGTAFHCLLWCYIKMNKIRKERLWKSLLAAQIHDSMFWDLHPQEEMEIIQTLHQVTTKDLLKAHPWICVPMDIEIEMTDVDQPWYTKKPIDLKGYLN